MVLSGHQRPARQLHDRADEVGGVWGAVQRGWGGSCGGGAEDGEEDVGRSAYDPKRTSLMALTDTARCF